MGWFARRKKTSHHVILAAAWYEWAIAQARAPVLFGPRGFPDTVDGRFESLALHVALVARRLRQTGGAAEAVIQALGDRFVADMDDNAREIGIADLKVGKHVRALAEALYGRLGTYGEAITHADARPLEAALTRNLSRLPGAEAVRVDLLAQHARDAWAALSDLDDNAVLEGAPSA